MINKIANIISKKTTINKLQAYKEILDQWNVRLLIISPNPFYGDNLAINLYCSK